MIQFSPIVKNPEAIFSILIPSWNNLDYLKCCINSIRKNSKYTHEIIVHVNEGKDGTLEWVKDQNISYTYSNTNVGVCYGFNAPASLATCNYLVLSDDDFYYAPDWDLPLLEDIHGLEHDYFCISGTMIEHSTTTNKCAIAPHDFGKTVFDFNETRFLKEFSHIPFHNWTGGNWYPLVLPKKIWQLIGGLSTEFTPGMGSDPDMMMKLWNVGVRYYKGLEKSRIYHFISKSTARVKKNDGHTQFLLKWGLSISTFFNACLRLGNPFYGEVDEPDWTRFRIKLLRDKIKRIFSGWRKNLPA